MSLDRSSDHGEKVAKLIAAASDCADDLEAEIKNRYRYSLSYPHMKKKYDLEMSTVADVRKAIADLKDETDARSS
jgi:hypothetical protein